MPKLTNVTTPYMVTISVFCNLKEPLVVHFIIIAHQSQCERLFEHIGLYNFNIPLRSFCAHW